MIVTNITGIGDPQILLHNGKYYCYATSHPKGFLVRESDDLICWSEPVLCFDASDNWGDNSYWAPEVVCLNGRFIMHYTARDVKKNDTLYLGVAVADSPLGPFRDVHGAPMFDFGYAAIDGSVLITEEGNYLYYSRDCSQNVIDGIHTSQIYGVMLDETLTRTVGEPKLMTTPVYDWELISRPGGFVWNEGPTVIKYGDVYLMNYSANCYATNDYSVCIATAEHPMGPWKKSPEANPVLRERDGLFGAGHNAFFTSKDGRLMTSFHVQTDPEHPGGNRRVCIGEVILEERDGILYEDIV